MAKENNEKKILLDLLPRTFKSPLGRKGGLVAYSIFLEKNGIESCCLFYLQNPDHSQCDLESYKLSIKFNIEQRLPAEAFRLLFEAFRLKHEENDIFFGRLSLLSHGILEAGIMTKSYVMQSFVEYVRPHTTDIFFKEEMHPNGTGCTAGPDHHCSPGCGKFAGNL